jgi:hypothetical protein
MQEKRDACMLDCKKSYDPNSLKVISEEKPIDPNAIADPKCIGQKQKQVQCYTEQCKKQFNMLCIKNGMTLPPRTKAPNSSSAGHSCSGTCKKKTGCFGDDCDMMCDFKCTF